MKIIARFLVLMTLVGLFASCGSSEETPIEQSYSIVATIDPDPPVVGQNTLNLTLEDLDGVHVEGATIVVDPQMPAHGHGSNEDPVVEERGEGTYKAFPLTFTMPGTWEVTVTATHAKSGQQASTVLEYDVQ